MEIHEQGDTRMARAARHLAETFIVAAVLTVLQLVGFLAEMPIWLPSVLILVASFVMAGAFVVWPSRTSRIQLHLRLAVQTAGVAVPLYAIGWGPAVAVALGFGIADSMKFAGSKAARPGLGWAATSLAVGQLAISGGVAPTLIPEPAVHGLAILAGFGLTFVVHRFEQMAAEKERFETSLRRREEHFRALVQNSSDVILVIDEDATLTYISPSVQRVFGYEASELIGMPLSELVHPDDRREHGASLANLLETPGHAGALACRWRHEDGTWRYVETVAANKLHDPELRGVVLNTRDVSERRQLEEQLEHRAFHDSLTELANRALFRDRVDHAVVRNTRRREPFAVLFLDLDGFKNINDSFGHAAGDELLRVVASRLRRSLRDADTAARLGGDEFAILIEELADDSSAARVADRLLHAIRGEVTVADGNVVQVDGSIGIAVSTGSEDGEEMLRNADIAMYMAKSRGKGTFEIFEPSMHTAVVTQLKLESDLSEAVENGDFVLQYQPIVDLETGRLSTLEALVRWKRKGAGLVPPNEFIPLAEETGLIVPLGDWVLRRACEQMRTWQTAFPSHPPVRVSVNLAAKQLLHPGIVTHVADALEDSGLPADSLILEITESALVAESAATIDTFNQLKRLGVRLAIDDFGTGYSSLGYLQRFPLDILKIDRSFIDKIDTEEGTNPELIRAIVDIGHSLNLETVAEGIERSTQLEQFRSLRCQLGQGFYFARPADPVAVEQMFTRGAWEIAEDADVESFDDLDLEEFLASDANDSLR